MRKLIPVTLISSLIFSVVFTLNASAMVQKNYSNLDSNDYQVTCTEEDNRIIPCRIEPQIHNSYFETLNLNLKRRFKLVRIVNDSYNSYYEFALQ